MFTPLQIPPQHSVLVVHRNPSGKHGVSVGLGVGVAVLVGRSVGVGVEVDVGRGVGVSEGEGVAVTNAGVFHGVNELTTCEVVCADPSCQVKETVTSLVLPFVENMTDRVNTPATLVLHGGLEKLPDSSRQNWPFLAKKVAQLVSRSRRTYSIPS